MPLGWAETAVAVSRQRTTDPLTPSLSLMERGRLLLGRVTVQRTEDAPQVGHHLGRERTRLPNRQHPGRNRQGGRLLRHHEYRVGDRERRRGVHLLRVVAAEL